MRACAGVVLMCSMFLGAAQTRAEAENPRPRAAIVAGGPNVPDEAHWSAARAQLALSFELVVDADVRGVLETLDQTPSPEQRVAELIGQAHERLRQFKLDEMKRLLEEAKIAAARLPSTVDGRRLVAKLAVEEALLALVKKDVPTQRTMLALALSADPGFQLDETLHPPALVRLFDETRAQIGHPSRERLLVESSPSGASVIVAGTVRGKTPVTLRDLPDGPLVLWLISDGSHPHVEWLRQRASSAIRITLDPLDAVDRVAPLVDALRKNEGDRKRLAASALALALGVDAVAVISSDGAPPVIYSREHEIRSDGIPFVTSSPRPSIDVAQQVRPTRVDPPWYHDWIGDALGGIGVVGVAGGGTLLLLADRHAESANQAATLLELDQQATTAHDMRVYGTAAVVAGSSLLIGGIVRFVLRAKGF